VHGLAVHIGVYDLSLAIQHPSPPLSFTAEAAEKEKCTG
jgi:hypothetical protein